jgi:hypothetical protein
MTCYTETCRITAMSYYYMGLPYGQKDLFGRTTLITPDLSPLLKKYIQTL